LQEIGAFFLRQPVGVEMLPGAVVHVGLLRSGVGDGAAGPGTARHRGEPQASRGGRLPLHPAESAMFARGLQGTRQGRGRPREGAGCPGRERPGNPGRSNGNVCPYAHETCWCEASEIPGRDGSRAATAGGTATDGDLRLPHPAGAIPHRWCRARCGRDLTLSARRPRAAVTRERNAAQPSSRGWAVPFAARGHMLSCGRSCSALSRERASHEEISTCATS